jgi:hypothetical protein
MPGFYEIRWLPDGGTEKFAGSRGNYYEFEDGSRLDMETTPVWCRHCGKVMHGEEIESLADIDKNLADMNDPNSAVYRITRRSLIPELDRLMPKDNLRLDMIEKAKKRRLWREQRRAGPKCIVCGSTDIFVFPMNQQVAHPAGAGTVEVSFVGMCSTSFNEWFFTPEGDRIPRDTRPTYWHHPELDKPEHRGRFIGWIQSKIRGGGPAAS